MFTPYQALLPRSISSLLLSALCVFSQLAQGQAQADSVHAGLTAPPIAATAYLLVDLTAKQNLVAYHIDERREPASLTKRVTSS